MDKENAYDVLFEVPLRTNNILDDISALGKIDI